MKRNLQSIFYSFSALIRTWVRQRKLLYEWWRGCDSQHALLIISPSLLTEALPFMHTRSNWSQIAHWYSEVLISSWNMTVKGSASSSPLCSRSSSTSFRLFFLLSQTESLSSLFLGRVEGNWRMRGVGSLSHVTQTHTQETISSTRGKGGLGRLQQYNTV